MSIAALLASIEGRAVSGAFQKDIGILAHLLFYVSIAAIPLWMAPLHAGCQRILSAIKPNVSVQVSALAATAVLNLIYFAVLVGWTGLFLAPRFGDGLAGILYVALAVNGLAFFYFQLVNVALTSIHMSLLLRVFWAGSLSRDALYSQYNEKLMIDERLGRLVQLRQIEVQEGRVQLRSMTMVIMAMPIYLWRRLLGFPN